MPSNVERYEIPTRLDDALQLIAEEGRAAAVVSGATVLALNRAPRIKTLVDLSRCGLDTIDLGAKTIRLGSTVCAAAIAAEPKLDVLGHGLLREAAAAIAPQAVRNQVTVGGNLVGVLSWSDMPVALLALGARVTTQRHRGKGRVLPLEELFSAHPRKVLAQEEIVTDVEVDVPPKSTGGAFIKIAPTVSDVAWVNAAAVLDVKEGVCQSARVAVGAVQPRHFRALAAEKVLAGAKLDDEVISRAADAAVEGLAIWSDVRASKEHRRTLLRVAVQRGLKLAWQRAEGHAGYEAPRRVAPRRWRRDEPTPRVGRVLSAIVDGARRNLPMRPHDNLLDVLRRGGVLSVKRGCDEGYCGTCSVLIDGRLVNACVTFAAQADGCEITTAAGIGTVFEPHPLQRAFVDEGAVQCGFCTPGMIVAAKSLLDRVHEPTDDEVREAMDGNLCRCTGYVKPLKAVHTAVRMMRDSQA